MNIALVTPEFVTEENFDGGLSNYIYRLSLSLLELGHNPYVYILAEESKEFSFNNINVIKLKKKLSKQINFLEKIGIYKYFFKSFFIMFFSYMINKKIRHDNKDIHIDIIQFTHLGAFGLFRPSKIPSVVRMSSYTPLINKANNQSIGVQQNFWEQLAIYRCDGVFSPSKIIADIESKIIRKKVTIIESPFTDELLNLDYSFYENKLVGKSYFLYFGTLNRLKGIETIGKTLSSLFHKYPQTYFVFVGKDQGLGSETCLEFLKKSAGDFQKRIIWFDKLPHSKLYPIIEHAELVVLPSRIDNFPNTCIEAMAHKKIVIGTRGTSFEQLIVDGKNGFLCEIDNDKSLLDTIIRAMKLDPNEKIIICNKAKERIDDLRPEISITKLVNFYSEVITKKNNKK